MTLCTQHTDYYYTGQVLLPCCQLMPTQTFVLVYTYISMYSYLTRYSVAIGNTIHMTADMVFCTRDGDKGACISM